MEVFLERCAGLDVHQASVVCRVLIGAPGRKAQKLLRSFGTTTRELEALRAWLIEHGVAHLGMEGTGVHWKPFYAVLEGHVDLIVGNAHPIKNVPGRKTDVKDAEWIAHTIRMQLRIGTGRAVAAGLRRAEWDDMAYLQAAVGHDDALDDELQDRLLVGECRCLQPALDADAERFQAGAHGLGLDTLPA